MAEEVKKTLAGEWKLRKSENFDAFLDKQGLNFLQKKAMATATPTQKIEVGIDETITISISFGLKTNSESFKFGEDYHPKEKTVERARTTWADGKMTTVSTPKDSKKTETTVVREIVDGEMVQTMTIDDVVCKRIFKKV